MKTLVFGLHTSDENKEIITSLQKDYTIAFHKMYNNMELMKDPDFIKSLPLKSKKQIEYLQKEVESFYDRNEANKLKILANITKLESYDDLALNQFQHLQCLKKSLNKNICFGNKTELIKLSKGKGDINIWRESRLLPLVFYGETSRYSNRFFDLKDVSNGNILFKLEATDIRIPIIFNAKKHLKELIKLEVLIKNRKIAITVKLTKNKLYITFDESILNNTNIDIKAFYKTIKDVKDKDERKVLIHQRYIEHENNLKKGKLDRYLAIDLNPNGIGYCVLDKDVTVIDKGYIDVSKTIKADKRRYETSIMIKELFKLIKHYRCHTIIMEELNFKSTNLGNKISNRKVNNLWNRTIISEIINRRCNEEGILKIEVNPCYKSFIGNIQYNEYDPIAASMEIGRRGIHKYSKGGFYPELDITNFINDEMYDEIKGCLTWKDLKALFDTAKRSYRRELNEFSFVGYNLGSIKSGVNHVHFL